MDIGQFGIVLIIGIFTSHANAGEQQEQDHSPMRAISSTQESKAIQTIRWRVAESCYRNCYVPGVKARSSMTACCVQTGAASGPLRST